ncbi:ABC-2 type transport system permease protein [Paenibacillus sp. UNCCL117]|uniref:ABC transporter permease n=1 Tax=unclassified Paenibacillus TaxID=185978 RepID=UPI00088D8CCF|nr:MULTISPECIES: ABC transporter permease [unclassified Paenibacillus]SDC78856.1 ABC-2 type transport system permease protein [Paenibacillus sp. cl123]SFW26162.1 ABC-2 type transport system permease protein [Paenibacillus sp. UNCCL117]
MQTVWLIAWNQMKMAARAKVVMIVLLVLPLLLIMILGAALSSSFDEGNIKLKPVDVTIVSLDQGYWNDRLMAFLTAPGMEEVMKVGEGGSREEAVEQLRTGRAQFAAIIPAGFGQALMQGEGASWELIAGKEREQNLLAESIFGSFLDTVNGMQAAVLTAGAPQAGSWLADPGAAQDRQAYVEVGQLGKRDRQYTAIQYYAAAMLIMFMLYSGMMAAISLAEERESHTLARLSSLPVTMNQIVGGKIWGYALLSLLQAVVIIGFTRYVYGVDWGDRSLLLAGNCIALVASSMSIAMLLTVHARTIKAVTGAFQIIIIAMTLVSGGFMPELPAALQLLGKLTVNYWGMQSILHLMTGEQAAAEGPLLVLGALAGLLAIVSGLTYWRVGYRE